MSRIENLHSSYEQAKLKKEAIEANSAALLKKRNNIEKQLKANQEKIRKLNFFLEKTQQAIEGKNTSTPS